MLLASNHLVCTDGPTVRPLGYEGWFAKWHFVPFSDNCRPPRPPRPSVFHCELIDRQLDHVAIPAGRLSRRTGNLAASERHMIV